jgi:PHD/YefM family antitoxin component YafN of YafNO toxin-antitoxin module
MTAQIAYPLTSLPVAAASSVKKDGWRGMMRALAAEGKLLITNHNQPEAVILSTAENTRLVEAAQAARNASPDPLVELRRRFDERLAVLAEDAAGDALRSAMRSPGQLGGRVKAGSTF